MKSHELPAPCGTLLALLCNPTLGEVRSTITWRNLEVLAGLLHVDHLRVENLICVASVNTRALREAWGNIDLDRWRATLAVSASASDFVLSAWGTYPPRGWPTSQWRAITSATVDTLVAVGHERLLQVGAGPRHPSRWRQHTSPIHKRYAGADFPQRLLEAISWSPLNPPEPRPIQPVRACAPSGEVAVATRGPRAPTDSRRPQRG